MSVLTLGLQSEEKGVRIDEKEGEVRAVGK